MRTELARLLREARMKQGLSVPDLARIAGVSNKTILFLEDADQVISALDDAERPISQHPRKAKALARSIARLAVALGKEVRPWVQIWSDLTTVRLGDSFYQELEATEKSPPNQSDLYNWFCGHPIGEPIQVRVGTLIEGDWAAHRVQFYDDFADMIFKKLGSRDKPSPLRKSDLQELYQLLNERKEEQRIHALVGVSKTVARRRNRIDFIPIPGLRFGLACLSNAPPVAGSTDWQGVIKAPARLNSRRAYLRVVAIKSEIGATYLVDDCGYQPRGGATYGFQTVGVASAEIAELLARLFADDERTGKQTVFVCGEEHAYDVKRALIDKNSAFRTSIRDIAAGDDTVPSFEETIAVCDRDLRWKELIEQSIQECFENSSRQMASLYARYYSQTLSFNESDVRNAIESGATFPLSFRYYNSRRSDSGIFAPFFASFRDELRDLLAHVDAFDGMVDAIIEKVIPIGHNDE